MTRPSLAGIEKRAEEATEGPWWTTRALRPPAVFSGGGSASDVAVLEAFEPAVAALIAHARTDLPALTAAVRDVLALHVEDRDFCRDCDHAHPCPTVRALAARLDLTDPEGDPT